MSLFAEARAWIKTRDSVERGHLRMAAWVLALAVTHAARGFWFLIPMDPFTGIIYLGVLAVAAFHLFKAIYRVILSTRIAPAKTRSGAMCLIALLGALAVFFLCDPYLQGARLRFWVQGGEAAYLRFAAEVRAKQPAPLPQLPADASYEQLMQRERLEKAQSRDFQSSLDRRLLDHHPTSWSGAGVLRDRIQLSSGSGLTGSWGIEIHDQPEISPMHTKAETDQNPYLPRQRYLSSRVWFWTSD